MKTSSELKLNLIVTHNRPRFLKDWIIIDDARRDINVFETLAFCLSEVHKINIEKLNQRTISKLKIQFQQALNEARLNFTGKFYFTIANS